MNYQCVSKLNSLINANEDIVKFGTSEDAVGEASINMAEAALRRKLSESYKWFLNTYVGGEISGEEIYSIYGLPFECVNGGDIVFKHLLHRKSGLLDDSKMVISTNDYGEVFFFDYDQWCEGECPIMLRLPSGENVFYANDFCEFLCKRIIAYLDL